MAATNQAQSTAAPAATRRYWRRADKPRPWWPGGALPLLGLINLFLIGASVMAPKIEDEVGNAVAESLAVAGGWVEALTVDGQHVTARIGPQGPDTEDLGAVAEATTCSTWAGELRCPTAVVLERSPLERVAVQEMAASEEEAIVEPEVVSPLDTIRTLEACNEAFEDMLDEEVVQFRDSSAQVLPVSNSLLQRLADLANACPGAIKVEAHTDSEGFASMNAALSQARANAVRDAFVKLGVERERMRAIGYGESRPIVDDYGAEGRAANNRIVISVDEPE